MREYGVMNNTTNEQIVIFGYSVDNAFLRSGKDKGAWTVLWSEYID